MEGERIFYTRFPIVWEWRRRTTALRYLHGHPLVCLEVEECPLRMSVSHQRVHTLCVSPKRPHYEVSNTS